MSSVFPLYHDILTRVFYYLPLSDKYRCSLVCKEFAGAMVPALKEEFYEKQRAIISYVGYLIAKLPAKEKKKMERIKPFGIPQGLSEIQAFGKIYEQHTLLTLRTARVVARSLGFPVQDMMPIAKQMVKASSKDAVNGVLFDKIYDKCQKYTRYKTPAARDSLCLVLEGISQEANKERALEKSGELYLSFEEPALAVSLIRQIPNLERQVDIWIEYAKLSYERGQILLAEYMMLRAFIDIPTLSNTRLEIGKYLKIARVYIKAHRYEDALHMGKTVNEIIDTLENPQEKIEELFKLREFYQFCGAPAKEAHILAKLYHHLVSLPSSYIKMCDICVLSDCFYALHYDEDAHICLLEAIAILDDLSTPADKAHGAIRLAQSFYNQKARDEELEQKAFALWNQVKEGLKEMNNPELRIELLFKLSHSYYITHHRSNAGSLLREAERLIEEKQNLDARSAGMLKISQVYRDRGDTLRAKEILKKLKQISKK